MKRALSRMNMSTPCATPIGKTSGLYMSRSLKHLKLILCPDGKPAIKFGADRELAVQKNVLLVALDKLHTTPLGEERIRRNLGLQKEDPVEFCRAVIQNPQAEIKRAGKNWYATADGRKVTVNAGNYCIITAHKVC